MTVRKKVAKRASRATASTSSRVSAKVQTILNGQLVGEVDPTGLTIGQAAQTIAKAHGIKSYSILVDGGMKITAEEASHALAGHTSIECFAKETRG